MVLRELEQFAWWIGGSARLTPVAQGMLLRILREGEGRPVGPARSITVDVRVFAATHRDLEAGVERGTFRDDF